MVKVVGIGISDLAMAEMMHKLRTMGRSVAGLIARMQDADLMFDGLVARACDCMEDDEFAELQACLEGGIPMDAAVQIIDKWCQQKMHSMLTEAQQQARQAHHAQGCDEQCGCDDDDEEDDAGSNGSCGQTMH